MSKAYPKYKPSGVEWLGDVPEHWEVKKLKFIGTALIGLTYSPDEVVDEDYSGKKHLVLRSTNIQDGKISLHDNVYVTTPVQNELEVRKWDILICARNGSRHLVGKNALVTETDTNMTFGAFTTVYRSKINRFLFYFFASSQFQYQSTGFLTTTINQLTNGNLNSILTTLPPLPEQQAIAAFLDRETGRIDALIAKKERLLELLAEQRTALISRAVTKGLDASVKLKLSGVEWLGDVPEHWEVKKLSWLFSYSKGPNAAQLTKDYIGQNTGDYPVYSGQTENDGLMGEIDSYDFDFQYPVIFVTTVGAKAMSTRLVQGKFSLSQNCALVIPRNAKVDSRYFEGVLRPLFDYEKRSISLIMQPSLRFEDLNRFRVPLPPLSEQQAIAACLGRETAKIDTLSVKVSTVIERLKEYRTALISSAVTGKIDVREAV